MLQRIFTLSLLSAALVIGPALPLHAQATPTRIMVRAVAHDAKVIGSNVGGARITIRELRTGEVLASGVQQGTTGSTRLLSIEPIARGAPVYEANGAAGFLATVPLSRPTMVEVAAEGPLGTPHAAQRASKTLLLVPGVDLLGNGIILELNGFTVEIEAPEDSASTRAGEAIDVRATVTMLCGCPTEPGGLWDADRIQVRATLLQEGTPVAEADLAYAGERSTFAGSIPAPAAGTYELRVVAYDAERANLGMATRPVIVP